MVEIAKDQHSLSMARGDHEASQTSVESMLSVSAAAIHIIDAELPAHSANQPCGKNRIGRPLAREINLE